jgi:hypothetical protein
MKNLPLPNSQLQEVFRELLLNDFISVRQMMADTGILNIKARISELRRIGLPIATDMVSVTNKYGRSARFGQWHLKPEAKQKAKEIYLNLLKN